jgi:hypothetical protein
VPKGIGTASTYKPTDLQDNIRAEISGPDDIAYKHTSMDCRNNLLSIPVLPRTNAANRYISGILAYYDRADPVRINNIFVGHPAPSKTQDTKQTAANNSQSSPYLGFSVPHYADKFPEGMANLVQAWKNW